MRCRKLQCLVTLAVMLLAAGVLFAGIGRFGDASGTPDGMCWLFPCEVFAEEKKSDSATKADSTGKDSNSQTKADSAEQAGQDAGSKAAGDTVDMYIKVSSGDGSGAILREQPSQDAAQVLRDAIPDGTVLHITKQVTNDDGSTWGYTNYSDVASGYILLSETAETAKKDLLQPSEEELRKEAERQEQEARIALIRQYFQTVDENGNVIEDDVPFVNDTSDSAASDPGGPSEDTGSVKSGSADHAESVASVSSSSVKKHAEAVRSESAGTESLQAVSSSSQGGALQRKIAGIPVKLLILIAAAGGAAVAVLFLLRRRRGHGKPVESDATSSDETSPDGKLSNAPSSGKRTAASSAQKRAVSGKAGLHKPKSKPIKEEKARKVRKKK